MRTKLEEMVGRHMAGDYRNGRDGAKEPRLYPSSFGGCARKEMLRVADVEITDEEGPVTKWKLARYKTYEIYLVDAAKAAGVYVAPPGCQEQHVLDNGLWRARLDLVTLEDDDVAIVEIKSLEPGGLKYKLPQKHHVAQALVYWVLDMENPVVPQHPADELTLAYITRWRDGDVPTLVEIDITPGRLEIQAILDQMGQLERAAARKEISPIPYKRPDEHPWACTYYDRDLRRRCVNCSYFGHCWESQRSRFSPRR